MMALRRKRRISRLPREQLPPEVSGVSPHEEQPEPSSIGIYKRIEGSQLLVWQVHQSPKPDTQIKPATPNPTMEKPIGDTEASA